MFKQTFKCIVLIVMITQGNLQVTRKDYVFNFGVFFFALGVVGVEHKNKHISVGCQIDTCTYNIMIKIHVS